MRISNVPKAYWVALVIAALGFVVSFSWTQTSSIDGVAACSFLDLGPILAALASLGLVGVAIAQQRRRHPNARVPMPWIVGGSALVAAIAVVHVLRGVGILGGPC